MPVFYLYHILNFLKIQFIFLLSGLTIRFIFVYTLWKIQKGDAAGESFEFALQRPLDEYFLINIS
jgi:hypothetical protein